MQSSSTKVVASTVAFTGGDAREVACWGSGGSREHTRMCGVAFFCLTLFVIQGTLLPGGTQDRLFSVRLVLFPPRLILISTVWLVPLAAA
jgi:hypothetical protein